MSTACSTLLRIFPQSLEKIKSFLYVNSGICEQSSGWRQNFSRHARQKLQNCSQAPAINCDQCSNHHALPPRSVRRPQHWPKRSWRTTGMLSMQVGNSSSSRAARNETKGQRFQNNQFSNLTLWALAMNHSKIVPQADRQEIATATARAAVWPKLYLLYFEIVWTLTFDR